MEYTFLFFSRQLYKTPLAYAWSDFSGRSTSPYNDFDPGAGAEAFLFWKF